MIEQEVAARLDPAMIELQREVLNNGYPLRIKLYGMSMYPAIRPGEVTVVRSVLWEEIRRGDILLFERESRLIAHRVIVPPFDKASPLIAMGDTLLHFDPPVCSPQLLGRVEGVERGGKSVSLTTGLNGHLQRVAADVSLPYARLFWKVAYARRRMLKGALAWPPVRARRRRNRPFEIQVRPCEPDDLDALANSLWDLQPQLTFARLRGWVEERIRWQQEAGATLLVAGEGRRILGIAVLGSVSAVGIVALADWYLHPLARGFGFGETLLDAAAREAAALGASELSVVVPRSATVATRLLRKAGWQRASGMESLPSVESGTFQTPSGGGSQWRQSLVAWQVERPLPRPLPVPERGD